MTNVAITRAIDRLIIIGDLNYLATAMEGTSLWKDVKDSFKRRNCTRVDAADALNTI